MDKWRRLMAALGLTRVGSYAFTAAAIGGILLTVADDAMPRSGSEADLGPNVAAAVGFYTLVVLALIRCADAAYRGLRGLFARDLQ